MPSESGQTDVELVGRAQAGDGEAFAELFRRHYPTVLRACWRRLGSDAEGVAQAAFVRAFERIGQCTGEQRFGGWVQVIARHLCADALRARARADAYATVLADRRLGHDPDWPEEHALRRERIEALSGVLRALPRRQREVLVARGIEGRRPAEIAAALGVSLGAVDSLLLRARRAAAAGYRTVAAEQGTASVASTAVAAMATGGAAAAPPPVWRALRRGAEAMWEAAVRFGVATSGAARSQLVAGTALVVALATPAGPGPSAGAQARPSSRPPAAVSSPGSALPSPALVVPAPAPPATPPTPPAPVKPARPTPPVLPLPSGAPAPPLRTPQPPNPLVSILFMADLDDVFDGLDLPGGLAVPDPGAAARQLWQAGRDTVTEAGTTGWQGGQELVREAQSLEGSEPR